MKVCVYGCGAIGGLLAARLAGSGADVLAVTRGAQLAAIRASGLSLVNADGSELNVPLRVTDDPAEAAAVDVVFLATKAHDLPAVAAQIGPLLGPATSVVSLVNGVPWWYFYGLQNDFGAPELVSVDPGRAIWRALGPQRAVGAVVYPAAVTEAPGRVRHLFGERFALGEPDGSSSERLGAIVGLLGRAGFDASVSTDLRAEIWTKLAANAAFNPVSVATGKTLGAMIDDPATHRLLAGIIAEVIAVAAAFGVQVPVVPEDLLTASRQLGEHKTSMLQDLAAGRPLELGPVVEAVLELAAWRGVAVPDLATVARLAAARAGATG